MQAIVVKYIGPTNTRGSSFRASAAKGVKPVIVVYDYALSPQDNARAACAALVRKMGWYPNAHGGDSACGGFWVSATLPNGDYVFVNASSTPHFDRDIVDTRSW